MDLKESVILGDSAEKHWYYQSKAAAMQKYVDGLRPRAILDLGAGSGFFTKHLLQHTTAELGICVDSGYQSDSDAPYFGKTLSFRHQLEPVDADLVLMMDVIEHVDDDIDLMKKCAEGVPSNARFFITVPAFQWLWSDHDVFLEHRRRYNLQTLEQAVLKAGLHVERSSYFFGYVFPLAVASRLGQRIRGSSPGKAKSQLREHSEFVNRALAWVCSAELHVIPKNRIAGLSVMCLARKI